MVIFTCVAIWDFFMDHSIPKFDCPPIYYVDIFFETYHVSFVMSKKSTPANCHATDRNYVFKRCCSSSPSSSRRRWKQRAFYPNWRVPSLVLTDHFWWPCTGVVSRASISNLSTVLFRNYRKSFSSRLNGAHAELQPLTNNRGSCWVINVLCALLCAVARGLVPGSLISTSFQEIDWYKQSDLIVIYYLIFWKAQGRRFFLAFEPPISCAVNGGPPVGNGDRSWSARSCYHPEVVWMVSSRVRLHRNCARIMQKGVFPAWLLSRFPTSVGSWHSPDQGKVCCYGNSCRWGACWTQGLHDPLHFPP